MSYANVGKVWSHTSLIEYLKTVKKPEWCRAVCIHHAAAPSLAQRKQGLLSQHVRNIAAFYKEEKGWRAGPHFFVDENEVFGMTPPDVKGIHAASFNGYSIGIEVLGDYDTEFHDSGRGRECWESAAITTSIILDWLGLTPNYSTVLFHRDDPKTSKTCPGLRVKKPWFLDLIYKVRTTPAPISVQPVQQFVPVAEYLQNIKGYSSSDISRLLKKDEDGLFFFGNEWLEGAYYDKLKQSTIAPISELCSLPKKK